MIKTNCRTCGKGFMARAGEVHKGFGKFCSRECFWISVRIWDEFKECLNCHNLFRPKIHTKKYCSRLCYFTHKISKECRTIDKDGYVLVKDPSDKSKRIREHRLVMQQHIGRRIKDNEAVHHINGIKDDNRIENLILMTTSKHMSIHQKGVKKSPEHCAHISRGLRGNRNKHNYLLGLYR